MERGIKDWYPRQFFTKGDLAKINMYSSSGIFKTGGVKTSLSKHCVSLHLSALTEAERLLVVSVRPKGPV